jgi:hypothetical protein
MKARDMDFAQRDLMKILMQIIFRNGIWKFKNDEWRIC